MESDQANTVSTEKMITLILDFIVNFKKWGHKCLSHRLAVTATLMPSFVQRICTQHPLGGRQCSEQADAFTKQDDTVLHSGADRLLGEVDMKRAEAQHKCTRCNNAE